MFLISFISILIILPIYACGNSIKKTAIEEYINKHNILKFNKSSNIINNNNQETFNNTNSSTIHVLQFNRSDYITKTIEEELKSNNYNYFDNKTIVPKSIDIDIDYFVENDIFSKNEDNNVNNNNNTNYSTANNSNYIIIEIDFLQTLTVKNVYKSDSTIYSVLIFSYIITFMAYFHVYNYKKKLDLLTKSDIEVNNVDTNVSKHTIHIRNLNRNLSYKEAQKLLTEFITMSLHNKNSIDIVSVQVIPNYDKIINLIDKKFSLESKLANIKKANNKTEHYFQRVKEKLKCKGGNVYYADKELLMKEKIKIINNLLNFYRKLIARKNTGNAFVCFKNIESAKNILKNKEEIIYSLQNTLHGSILNVSHWNITSAPSPSDIIWQNIKYSKKVRLIKMVFITAILFYVFLKLITPMFVRLFYFCLYSL